MIQRKEKRDLCDRAFLYCESLYYLYDLLVQQHKIVPNIFIVVVVAVQPIIEFYNFLSYRNEFRLYWVF